MLDICEYAQRKRYRVRDLADGLPFLPLRHKSRPKYTPSAQSEWAIVGRCGCVTAEGSGLGWVLACPTKGKFNPRLRDLYALPGVTVTADGDLEAYGTAPVEAIEDILRLFNVYRIPLRNPGGNPHIREIGKLGRDAQRRKRLVSDAPGAPILNAVTPGGAQIPLGTKMRPKAPFSGHALWA